MFLDLNASRPVWRRQAYDPQPIVPFGFLNCVKMVLLPNKLGWLWTRPLRLSGSGFGSGVLLACSFRWDMWNSYRSGDSPRLLVRIVVSLRPFGEDLCPFTCFWNGSSRHKAFSTSHGVSRSNSVSKLYYSVNTAAIKYFKNYAESPRA